MFIHSILLSVVLLLGQSLALPASSDSSVASTCSSYRVNSVDTALFAQHRFFDFRNVAISPRSNYSGSVTSAYFNSPAWTDNWSIPTWSRDVTDISPVYMRNTPQNLMISRNTDKHADSATYLSLMTARNSSVLQTAGEMDSTFDVQYLSIRIKARVLGSPGGVAGMFTYANDTQESDIEVLTRDSTSYVHYTNQPSTTFNESLPKGDVSSEWLVYRLDWLPGKSAWYVDGNLQAHTTDNVPSIPSKVILNMWSNGGSWTGEMAVGGVAELQVKWIEMVYNTSTTSTLSPGVVCSIDNENTIGVPIVSKTKSSRSVNIVSYVRAAISAVWQ